MTSRTGTDAARRPSHSPRDPAGFIPPFLERAGFTLIEVSLVAVVLAVLVAATLPRFLATSQRLQAERAAFELAQIFRYAHGRAVAQGDVIVVTWDADRRRASLGSLDGAEPAAWPTDCSGQPLPLSPPVQSAPVPEAMTVSLVREGGAVACAHFFPDGTSDSVALHLIHRSLDYTVTVHGPTSYVVLATRPAAP
jgi:prepilin-type N-terminal cleavage/methylation domain-containing protein